MGNGQKKITWRNSFKPSRISSRKLNKTFIDIDNNNEDIKKCNFTFILKLHNEGKSYSEIQKILGCSKGTISYHLGSGQKEKTVGRNRDSRNKISKFLQNYKQERVCADCKEDHPYWMLEFDHIRNKNFNLSKNCQVL